MTQTNEDNLVPPALACPSCGERNSDRLVWLRDDRVECQTCSIEYTPGEGWD